MAVDDDALRCRRNDPEYRRLSYRGNCHVAANQQPTDHVDDVLTIDKPAVFPVSKDRPILFSALATADVLLTLDRADFGRLLGSGFYGLAIMTPGMWLMRDREAERARIS